MQGREPVEEEPAEETRQHPHGQEEAGFAGDPARSVRRNAAAGNDDVDVRVVGEGRTPGVQQGGEADARAQMLRVGGDCGQRLGGNPEQEVVDGGLVVERDSADRSRQGEDDVIVGNRQKLRLAVCEPLPRRGRLALGAVAIAAGNGKRPLPALWGGIRNRGADDGAIRAKQGSGARVPPLPIGPEQRDQLIRWSKIRFGEMAKNENVNELEFFVEITVRRNAADVMGSGTDARQS